MRRPDQDRFDAFAEHFDVLDEELIAFCHREDFKLERNSLRQPCRVLRREGNPHLLIDISLSKHWLEMELAEDMQHNVNAIAYYEVEGSDYIWKTSRRIVNEQAFSAIFKNCSNYLLEARNLFRIWTPDVILASGEQIQNLRRKFGV